jgi:hypothetical protein
VTFAVRTITRSATGGDIVHRPRRFETDEVVIGRGSDCDIRLADLAVSLRHARMGQTAPGRVVVESIGAEPFEAAGKFTTRAELSLTDTPKLVFGSHVLILSAGASPEDGDVMVDVTRQESAPEGASAANEDKIFSLGKSGLGKRPIAWTLAILALALCLAWPVAGFITHANRRIHADQQWSTGPLSRAHAFLNGKCQACHVKALVSVRDDTCLSCHRATSNPETARQVAANGQSWGGPVRIALIREHAEHQRLLRAAPLPHDFIGKVKAVFERQFNHGGDRCASCHLEHLADTPLKGAVFGRTRAQPRAIPILRNVYSCTDCHAKLRRHLGSTTLRDTPDWRHHPEFRPLIARSPVAFSPPSFERISLVQQPIDYTGLIFSHQTHLSKSGGVARMAAGLRFAGGALACADCHRPDKSGRGFAPVEMIRDCSSCHSLAFAPGNGAGARLLPHGHADKVVATLRSFYGEGGGSRGPGGAGRQAPGFLAHLTMMFSGRPAETGATAAKVRALFAPRGLCSECHTTVAPSDPGSLDYRVRPINQTERFLPWGAFDHSVPEHRRDAAGRPTCESCHKASDSANATDVMIPRIAECAACHGKTKDKSTTTAPADCAECHSFHAPGVATHGRANTLYRPPSVAGVQPSLDGVSVTP